MAITFVPPRLPDLGRPGLYQTSVTASQSCLAGGSYRVTGWAKYQQTLGQRREEVLRSALAVKGSYAEYQSSAYKSLAC